jgi:membrane protein DedA with SNARE-associated domain
MFAHIEMTIISAAQTLYDAWGWGGVTLLIALENATGLTPSEVILGLAGWMLIAEHEAHPAMIFLGGLYAAVGSLAGASTAYWVSRLGGRPLVLRLARWVRIDPEHITMAEDQFNRWGTGLVFAGRLIPGVRTLVSIPAGLAHMPFGVFAVATFIGAYLWCSLLIGAGYFLGHEWELVSHYLELAFPYLLGGGILGLALWVVRGRLVRRSDPNQSDS